jgi:hypothetical protein
VITSRNENGFEKRRSGGVEGERENYKLIGNKIWHE